MSISNISFNSNVLNVIDTPIFKCPKEIISLICSYLENSRDVIQLASTNKYTFRFLASNSPFAASLWGLFLRKNFPDSYATRNPQKINESFSLYKRLTNTARNMTAGKCRLQTLNGHKNVITCMTSIDSNLISGSMDNTIKIWNLSTGKLIHTLSGHQDRITCMTILDGNLISGSWNKTIKIWDLSTGKLIHTLSGHQDRITCMTILDGNLISGSSDGTIKVWDLSTGQLLQALSGHQGAIRCITILDDNKIQDGKLTSCPKLVSGSWDGTIKIWDLSTGQVLQTLIGLQHRTRCMTILDGNLISGSYDNTIKILDLSTGKLIHTLSGHEQPIDCMTMLNGTLISSLSDCTIKIWDIDTGQELKTLYGHEGRIHCILTFCGKVISSSARDSKIKIWDPRTGKLLHTLSGSTAECITVLDGKIISGSMTGIISVWDFNSLSPYFQEVLEENLALLEKMLWAPYLQKSIEELTEKLHPDFQKRLRQHVFKLKCSYASFENAVLRVRIEVCLEALLNAIHEENHQKVSRLLDCLTWNRKNTEIYDLLGKICGQSKSWAEQAFRSGSLASFLQKEQAVIEFKQLLKDRWDEDLPPLLGDLGIVTKEEYSQKLKCRPSDLPARGIRSAEDLQALYSKALSKSPDFQYLQTVSEEATKDMIQARARVFKKQEIISALLNQLLNAAQKKSKETTPYSVIRDENNNVYDANPWIAFLEKLKNIQGDLCARGLNHDQFAAKFKPESYAELVKKVNALIDEFRVAERQTQILILDAYINQVGIHGAWIELQSDKINSLSALLKTDKAPQDIFCIGKKLLFENS